MCFGGSVWTIVGFGEKEPENLHIVQRKCVLPRFFHSRQLRRAAVVRAHGVAPQTFCPGDVDGGTRFAAAQALRGGVRIRVFKGKAVEIFHCFGDGGGTARIEDRLSCVAEFILAVQHDGSQDHAEERVVASRPLRMIGEGGA